MKICCKRLFFVLFALRVLGMSPCAAQDLESGFVTPADDTKPWVYWYWLDGDLSRDGITKDLEAMRQAGIGEALIGHINQENVKPKDGAVQVLSEEWYQLLDHAVREGKRLGVDIGMFNGPGWSQSGGPWIAPEESMQYVVSCETRVEGPMTFSETLVAPDGMITDIAVLAFPASDDDRSLIENNKPQIRFEGKKELAQIVPVGNGNIDIIDDSRIHLPDISNAEWIWFPEGNPVQAASAGDRYFRHRFIISDNLAIANASLLITADNAQWVWINGKPVDRAHSTNWREVNLCDITGYLKTGENVIAVKVNNEGASSSPAGLIAAAKINMAGGKAITIHTGSDWISSVSPADKWNEVGFAGADWEKAKVLGMNGILPWNRVQFNGVSTCSIDWELPDKFTARSLLFNFTPPNGLNVHGTLEALNPDGSFKTIKEFSYSRSVRHDPSGDSTMFLQHAPVIFTFMPTASKHFRLKLDRTDGVSDFKLSSAAMVENAAEKQLGRLWPTPLPNWDSYLWPQPGAAEVTTGAIMPNTVRNLSNLMEADGTLRWNVPEGQWIIKRFGTTTTGIVNRPAAAEATGLECDKMNKAIVAKHFEAMVGKTLGRISKDERKAVKHVVIDSYEVGGQNWTAGFEKIFKERLGYDPLPYLPVLDGSVVGSPDISERFLWDLRRLVADLISENYVGGLRDIANKNGLKLWLENYGHWGYPGEFLQYGGYADHVSGEFWTVGDLGSIELRDAASCVHTYGKGIVSAEAFTSTLNLSDHPFSLKPRGDWAFTEGINHFVLHVYAHQSEDLPAPGRNPWFGTPFHRNNPWFMEMRSWVRYLQRCNYMLQQGHHVADVAYFIGEDAPKMSGIRQQILPAGYNYDYINADVVRDRMVIKDGRWTLPDGMSYSVLALPRLETMRPELLTKIRDLVKKGGVIAGTPPNRSPSLQGFPACDKTVKKLAAEIWADCDGVQVKQRKFVKGTVFNGVEMQTVFDTLNIAPEVTIAEEGLLWTHRKDGNKDIYFISNQNSHSILANMSFRIGDRAPEIWDPVTGEIIRTACFQRDGDCTKLTVPMDRADSVFIVFSKAFKSKIVECVKLNGRVLNPAEATLYFDTNSEMKALVTESGKYTVQFTEGNQIEFEVPSMPVPVTVDGDWQVRFPFAMGLVDQKFDPLTPWLMNENENIKSFTGTATYRKTLDIPLDYFSENHRIKLNLGSVSVMAEVRINGKKFETMWKPPFELDITNAARPGKNRLEIGVTNSHGNNLSGLTGPVTISTITVVDIPRP